MIYIKMNYLLDIKRYSRYFFSVLLYSLIPGEGENKSEHEAKTMFFILFSQLFPSVIVDPGTLKSNCIKSLDYANSTESLTSPRISRFHQLDEYLLAE